jgi:hypothetical protein
MTEARSLVPIEDCTRGGRAEEDGDPFAPTWPEPQGLKDLQKIAPVDSIKGFVDVKLHE